MRIFLLGFMGSGKSHWGKVWADEYQLGFHDTDAMIEKKEQLTVIDIFEKKGEDHFRNVEASVLRELADAENCIISCGGGSACFYDNMTWMNAHGETVFLAASPHYLLKNVLAEKEKRPLVRNLNEAELIFFIEQKLKERQPFYSRAKHIIDAEHLNNNSLAGVITKL